MSLLNLFSDSVNIEISDVHLIFGPSKDNLSKDEEFSTDPKSSFYEVNDQLTNIVMMHEILEDLRKPEKQLASQKKREEKQQRRETRAK